MLLRIAIVYYFLKCYFCTLLIVFLLCAEVRNFVMRYRFFELFATQQNGGCIGRFNFE